MEEVKERDVTDYDFEYVHSDGNKKYDRLMKWKEYLEYLAYDFNIDRDIKYDNPVLKRVIEELNMTNNEGEQSQWKEVKTQTNREYMKLQENEAVEGAYVDFIVSPLGSRCYNLKQEDGSFKCVNGSFVLDDKMESVPSGGNYKVRITYLGKKVAPKSGRVYKDWKVEVQPATAKEGA